MIFCMSMVEETWIKLKVECLLNLQPEDGVQKGNGCHSVTCSWCFYCNPSFFYFQGSLVSGSFS